MQHRSLLRSFLCALPVVAVVLAACTDQTNPSSPLPTQDDPGETPPPGEPGDDDDDDDDDGPPPGSITKDLCKIEKKGNDAKVIRSTLLLPDTAIDGELVIDEKGIIACAAKDCSDAPGYDAATKIVCKNAVVSPGLINPHDHISFAHNKPHTPLTERFEHRHDWRRGLRGHTEIKNTGKTVANAVDAAELRFVMSGVTAIAGAGGAPGLVRNVDGSPAQLEAGLEMKIANSDTFPLNDGTPKGFPTTCEAMDPGRRTSEDIASLKGYLPHISEGIDEAAHAEIVCQSDDATPHDLIKRQTAVVHGIAVNPADVARFRKDMSILIWSPRSNIDLYGNTAPIALYDNLGVPIALGTDWLPSGSMNMSRELHCADELNAKYFGKKLTDKQLWQAVTINAAFAIGAQHALGQLRPGYAGDVVIFDATNQKNMYRAVIEAGVEDTVLVLRGGKPLYGDSALLPECESINVCNVTKKACVKKDLGKKTLADLEKAAKEVYPLFFCKGSTPTDEPSCEPMRGPTKDQPDVSVYSGIKAGDKDGDGVPDTEDNCPTVFNPIRPMDKGVQADVDDDQIGDACDKCPLDAGENCTPPVAVDVDGDGIANEVDNCPEDSNKDQVDVDKDGKGAVCDKNAKGETCDQRPNPGAMQCPATFTIAQLRRASDPGHPKPGDTRAAINGVWVTAVKDEGAGGFGYFIQESGTQYAGMFVSTGNTKPTVKVGNKVDVEGDYEEQFGQSQLSNATVKVTDPGTSLPFQPVVVTPATYASATGGEPWETMLCVVNGPVTVSNMNPDAPKDDHDEFAITSSSLRVDDFIYDLMGNDYPVGTTFQRIVGICGYSFSNRKIWPRSAADIPQ